jgi:hypothetical protein
MPLRIVPERGQHSENVAKSPLKQSCDVFQDDVVWSQFANQAEEILDKTRTATFKSGAFSREANILAGKSSADNINWSDIFALQFCNVWKTGNFGPVLGQHAPAERVDLAERHSGEAARAFQAEGKAANPAEKVQHAQFLRNHPPRREFPLIVH